MQTPIESCAEDIPSIVAEEIVAANKAGIPPVDQPSYVADRLRMRIAGTEQYVRKRKLSPSERAQQIRQRFTGRNVAALAVEYNLSPRRVRQIIREGVTIK